MLQRSTVCLSTGLLSCGWPAEEFGQTPNKKSKTKVLGWTSKKGAGSLSHQQPGSANHGRTARPVPKPVPRLAGPFAAARGRRSPLGGGGGLAGDTVVTPPPASDVSTSTGPAAWRRPPPPGLPKFTPNVPNTCQTRAKQCAKHAPDNMPNTCQTMRQTRAKNPEFVEAGGRPSWM